MRFSGSSPIPCTVAGSVSPCATCLHCIPHAHVTCCRPHHDRCCTGEARVWESQGGPAVRRWLALPLGRGRARVQQPPCDAAPCSERALPSGTASPAAALAPAAAHAAGMARGLGALGGGGRASGSGYVLHAVTADGAPALGPHPGFEDGRVVVAAAAGAAPPAGRADQGSDTRRSAPYLLLFCRLTISPCQFPLLFVASQSPHLSSLTAGWSPSKRSGWPGLQPRAAACPSIGRRGGTRTSVAPCTSSRPSTQVGGALMAARAG
jgi:hypothetical protein